MLVAINNNQRVEASLAEKGPHYICPNCGGAVTLKKGTVVIHHFAHKRDQLCDWSRGETREHMSGKNYLAQSLRRKGWPAEIECALNIPVGDRRADVVSWTSQNQFLAFEIQHSSIGLSEISERAAAYASRNIAQMWIPVLKADVWKAAVNVDQGRYVIEKFSAVKFIRWIHGFAGKHGMWMFDPSNDCYWHGRLSDYMIDVPLTDWREDGNEMSAGGYSKRSKRWKTLTLTGPFQFEQLTINIKYRKEFRTPQYYWPSGPVVHLAAN